MACVKWSRTWDNGVRAGGRTGPANHRAGGPCCFGGILGREDRQSLARVARRPSGRPTGMSKRHESQMDLRFRGLLLGAITRLNQTLRQLDQLSASSLDVIDLCCALNGIAFGLDDANEQVRIFVVG